MFTKKHIFRQLAFTALLFIYTSIAFTQETADPEKEPGPWKYGGRSAINFSQVNLTNWAAGGENSYSMAGLVQLFGTYNKGKANWANTLDLGYGIIKQGELGIRKSDDKVDLMSKFGYLAINRWYYSGMLNFKTQMDRGFQYENNGNVTLISDLMAPGYLMSSLGMEYKSKDDNFYLLISPFTGKYTFVFNDSLSDAGAYGLDPGTRMRGEFGGFIKTAYKKEIFKNVNLGTKLDLFSNYLENPQNVDVNMEAILMMKVNKFLVTSVTINLMYDDDINITTKEGAIGPRTQFKEVLAIGLSYSFGN
jgi:hypothetical protein